VEVYAEAVPGITEKAIRDGLVKSLKGTRIPSNYQVNPVQLNYAEALAGLQTAADEKAQFQATIGRMQTFHEQERAAYEQAASHAESEKAELRAAVAELRSSLENAYMPQEIIDSILTIGHDKIRRLIPLFENYARDRERLLAERAIKEAGVDLTSEE